MIDIGAWSMAVKLLVAWFLSRTEIISILGQSMFFPKGFIHKFQIFLSFRVGILENFFQIRHWPHLRFQLKCLKKTWDPENFKNILPVFCPFWRLIFVSSFWNSEKMCFFSLRFWIWILENSFLISNWNSALLIGAPWIRVWLITPTAPLLESLIHAWRENQYNYEATIWFFLLFCWFNLWLGKSLCNTIWIFSLLERSCHIVSCFIRFGMQAQRIRQEKAKKAQEASQEAGHEAGKILRQ